MIKYLECHVSVTYYNVRCLTRGIGLLVTLIIQQTVKTTAVLIPTRPAMNRLLVFFLCMIIKRGSAGTHQDHSAFFFLLIYMSAHYCALKIIFPRGLHVWSVDVCRFLCRCCRSW